MHYLRIEESKAYIQASELGLALMLMSLCMNFKTKIEYYFEELRYNRVQYFWGKVLNLNQSETRKHCNIFSLLIG